MKYVLISNVARWVVLADRYPDDYHYRPDDHCCHGAVHPGADSDDGVAVHEPGHNIAWVEAQAASDHHANTGHDYCAHQHDAPDVHATTAVVASHSHPSSIRADPDLRYELKRQAR